MWAKIGLRAYARTLLILLLFNWCDICDIRSFGEQSGRTTGRLGSTGLRAMPSDTAGTPELLPQLSQPGLGTISDDYGPAAIRRSKDLATAAGARATRKS